MVNLEMSKLPFKLAAIVAEIKISGKPPSAFFTVKAVDGSRLCHIGGQGIRVTDNQFYQILKALQPAVDSGQVRTWNLQRRAGGRD